MDDIKTYNALAIVCCDSIVCGHIEENEKLFGFEITSEKEWIAYCIDYNGNYHIKKVMFYDVLNYLGVSIISYGNRVFSNSEQKQ